MVYAMALLLASGGFSGLRLRLGPITGSMQRYCYATFYILHRTFHTDPT